MQITIDCADPDRLVHFWATALNYIVQPAPEGFATWRAYWLSIGVPADELGDGECSDSVVDPEGVGPRVWFQQVPESKTIKNRLHLDLSVGGGRGVRRDVRKERVDAEVARLTAAGATILYPHDDEGIDHYAMTMADPEGNEFCIN
jgi:glyoxalase superfamily protein